MTAQISDSFFYQGEHFDLVNIRERGLFNLKKHGLRPLANCSACWRGFCCLYVIEDGLLLLDKCRINLSQPAPPLFGVVPSMPEGFSIFDTIYQDMHYLTPFTGRLLLARDFIEELYVHMGFHPAWKYREVHELTFRKGTLVQARDRSKEAADLREQRKKRPLQPSYKAYKWWNKWWILLTELWWVRQCFSQWYNW